MDFDDLRAGDVARIDQATTAGVDVANMLVAFYERLANNRLPEDLCASLTTTYFDALLGAYEGVEDEMEFP